jgi:hypothetical protein
MIFRLASRELVDDLGKKLFDDGNFVTCPKRYARAQRHA